MTTPSGETTSEARFCTFYVGELFLGIEVEKIQEVIRYHEMTDVPTAPPEVRGLINLRGQIVTAIDARVHLGLETRPEESFPMNVVVRTEEGPRWSSGSVVSTHRSISAAPSFSSCVSSTADCRPSSVPA